MPILDASSLSPRNMLLYATTEAEILDPDRARSSMREIRGVGFESIYLEFRNVRAPRQGSRFLRSIHALVAIAREEGLHVALEASFNNLDHDLLESAPEAFTDSLRLHQVTPVDGKIRLELSGDPSIWTFAFAASAAYREDSVEIIAPLALGRPRIRMDGGGCAMTRQPGRSKTVFEWDLPSGDSAPLALLVTRKRFEYVYKDLAHPELLRRLPALLESRLVTGATELFFDEPHFGFAFYEQDGRAISDRLLQAFQNDFGYSLEQHLPELWLNVAGRNSALVRLNYAELLERSLQTFEESVRGVVARLSQGRATVHLGGHRTMHEELSDDVLIGCSDYFRHDAGTSASYTDSVFERPDSMVTMAQLARSMAACTPGRHAWNMSWGFQPTPDQQAYYAQMLGAMNVRWCLHAWNDSMMFGPGYPHHPCWETMESDLGCHKSYLEDLQGWEPCAETLLLYNWKAAATAMGAERHSQRRGLLLLGWTLTQCSNPFRIVDENHLIEQLDHESVKTVILHWADALDKDTWKALSAWVSNGGQLLLLGPIPRMLANGESAAEQVRDICGVRFTGLRLPLRDGDDLHWRTQTFALNPLALSPNLYDAPASTIPPSLLSDSLEVLSGEAVCRCRKVVLGAHRDLGVGTVTTLATEAAFAPGLVEEILSLPAAAPGKKITLPYKKGTACKIIELPAVGTFAQSH